MACAPKAAEIHKKSTEDKGIAQRQNKGAYREYASPRGIASVEEVLDDGNE